MLLAALTLHNLEEALAYRAMHVEIQAKLAALDIAWWSPSPGQFDAALAALTLGVAGLVAWAAAGESTDAKLLTLRALAAVLLINILAPHLPAALAFGGYVPGLLTALAVNLPIGLGALLMLRRERPGQVARP